MDEFTRERFRALADDVSGPGRAPHRSDLPVRFLSCGHAFLLRKSLTTPTG
ncbi:hypothetical protein [Streptomyces europaeiscabiei]|uniref:hypothetical protein n=1 Tax=Streptomyces europaeiscabiei TaxID=146819 RepID=UPI0029BF4F05|nr:hypothetical protein [Streptomyces europaeiscabiei]MDX3867212.1 hypothetical protein [Streptomyces europaeiscabiei]